MRALILSIAVAASILILSGNTFAKTASCPCSPCKCSPCTCGGGGGKGKHHHDHGSVGVGVNVDLGGVGQRKSEPDPFATTNQPSASTTTTRKETTTHKRSEQPTATTFDKIELTTDKAKDLQTSDTGTGGGPPIAGGVINVSNDTPTPVPPTQEKPKKKKKKWPKPIQDWVDAKDDADSAHHAVDAARGAYTYALNAWCYTNSQHYRELVHACADALVKAHSEGATQEDQDNANKACRASDEQRDKLEKDFLQTDDGKKAAEKLNDAQKASDKADNAERDAGKNVDQGTKDSLKGK